MSIERFVYFKISVDFEKYTESLLVLCEIEVVGYCIRNQLVPE